jgi:hypothetical protein
MAKDNQVNSSKLHDQGVYERDGTMEVLIGELEAISELDKHSEAGLEVAGKKRTWGLFLMVLPCPAFVGFLCLAIEIFDFSGALIFISSVFVFVCLLAVFIYGTKLFITNGKKIKAFTCDEFPDHRYLSCLELLRLLDADISSDASLHLRLNLKPRPVADSSNPNIAWKAESKNCLEESTIDPLLALSGRFQDGTKFDYELSETVTAYGEWFHYRAISGKTKTKLKARKRTRWVGELRLRFKQKRYSLSSVTATEIESLVQLPEEAKLKKVTAGESEVKLSASTAVIKQKYKCKGTDNIPSAWLMMPVDEKNASTMLCHFSAMMFLSLYAVLNSTKSNK